MVLQTEAMDWAEGFLRVSIAVWMWLLTIANALVGFLLSGLVFLQALIERELVSTNTVKVECREVNPL